jgi:pimeloyl-ACP methyl ester carboxylesterase
MPNEPSDAPLTITAAESGSSVLTHVLEVRGQRYAYRRFGGGRGLPLLFLQHFTGTLDNWDPAVTGPIAATREVILFDNAGIGGSSGEVPRTVEGMAKHALAFLDGLGLRSCDVLGFSLGGMVALQLAQDRPSLIRRMILVGTSPRGGEDIMHMEKPSLAGIMRDSTLKGYARLVKLFFTPTAVGTAAGQAFVSRLARRQEALEPAPGPEVATNQIAAFREWEVPAGERFADLRSIYQPALVVTGVRDQLIPASNSFRLVENLPNAALHVYPDAGHGSLFQYHASFVRHVTTFLESESPTEGW